MASRLESEVGEFKARFRYPDSKVFKEIIDGVSKIIDEARFTVSSEGLILKGMDPAKVAYIEVYVPAESFVELEVRDGEAFMGVNVEVLKNIVKRGKKGDPLEARTLDDKVYFSIESSLVKRYLLPNLDVVVEAPERIELEHDVKVAVISDVVKKALRDAEVVGDIVEFEADEDRLLIRGVGEGRHRAETRIEPGSPSVSLFEVKSPATSRYDVSYLKRVVNLAKIADTVTIGFSSDRPIELVFNSPDGSRVRFLLAPSTT